MNDRINLKIGANDNTNYIRNIELGTKVKD